MTHDWHEKLPGYHPDQMLHDGCGECEERAEGRNHGLASLDTGNFTRAWIRAALWNRGGAQAIAAAEVPMLDVLWAVQCQLEKRGVPIGQVPS